MAGPRPSRDPAPPAAETAAAPEADRRAGTTAALAIGGLILAVVPCCPLTGLAGAFLGLVALRRMQVRPAADAATPVAAPATSRGVRRMAIIAVVAGVVSALVWSIVLDRYVGGQATKQTAAMSGQLERFIVAAQSEAAGDEAAALPRTIAETWASADDAAPDPEAATAFGGGLRERYGRFQRLKILSEARTGSMLRPLVDVSVVLHFETGSPVAAARFHMLVATGRFAPEFRLVHLAVEDGERGPLALGVPPAIDGGADDPASPADEPADEAPGAGAPP